MQERDQKCNHTFVCVRQNGDFGEIIIKSALTPAQINSVRYDATKAENVCPHGAIQCGKCRESLTPKQEGQNAPTTRVILDKLNRPR
ncbi:MAG: hypothetical protein H0W89_04480 [Candidatus Levybacteria bacterium]|nr:hypothetical protein [Candidatus Levybacteria bacterium]